MQCFIAKGDGMLVCNTSSSDYFLTTKVDTVELDIAVVASIVTDIVFRPGIGTKCLLPLPRQCYTIKSNGSLLSQELTWRFYDKFNTSFTSATKACLAFRHPSLTVQTHFIVCCKTHGQFSLIVFETTPPLMIRFDMSKSYILYPEATVQHHSMARFNERAHLTLNIDPSYGVLNINNKK